MVPVASGAGVAGASAEGALDLLLALPASAEAVSGAAWSAASSAAFLSFFCRLALDLGGGAFRFMYDLPIKS